MSIVIGWDVGGAHLKLARSEDGVITAARQIACPLWLGLGRLEAALDEAMALSPGPASYAITMTAELADVFADRAAGVGAVLDAVTARLPADRVLVYALGDFLAPGQARGRADRVASANWHATAALAARNLGDGLLVDIGSTTTDLVPLRAGAVAARGFNDAERLAVDALLYRGVVRTPVMAMVKRLSVAGERVGVMAELFATAGDVFRLAAGLPVAVDQHPTADGRGKSAVESRARLARMVGRDAASAPDALWDDLARQIAAATLSEMAAAARRVTRDAALPAGAPLLGAGIGRFLAATLARRLRRPYRDYAEMIPVADAGIAAVAADCAPAAAVALLAARASRKPATAALSMGASRPPRVSAERKPRKSGRSGSNSGTSAALSDPASPARRSPARAKSRKAASAVAER